MTFGTTVLSLLLLVIEAEAACFSVAPSALRAHVEFLSSDELAGRPTPSKELDIAAEYIAVQFRRAGLDPQPDGTYFQAGGKPRTRNVIAVLKGSDPKLADQYVLLTAHYDHIGKARQGEGDLINNGANDNASGVSSMIEIAGLLASAKPAPRRTIVFIAFYGEELGLFGSRFYAKHPVFPVEKTVAQLNLEQTGRTDDLEGSNAGIMNVSGFKYSQVANILWTAAAPCGIRVVERPKWTDEAFERSDNEALAKRGIPAHTLSAAYMFPDYHKPADEWQKLDYDNMAKFTAAAAAGALAIANRIEPPHWLTGAPASLTRGPAETAPQSPSPLPASTSHSPAVQTSPAPEVVR